MSEKSTYIICGESEEGRRLASAIDGEGIEAIVCDGSTLGDTLKSAPEASRLYIVPDMSQKGNAADIYSLKLVSDAAAAAAGRQEPLETHLFVRSRAMLRQLRRKGLASATSRSIDLVARSLDEEWLDRIRLDRKPINAASGDRVRVVIFGNGDRADAAAIMTALAAHYPNHNHNLKLRTRIVMVSETPFDRFIADNEQLVAHSHSRVVDTSLDRAVTKLIPPRNELGEISDIEWEFVKGTAESALMRSKLEYWSADPTLQLSVIMASDDDTRNLLDALSLPRSVRESDTAAYYFTADTSAQEAMGESSDGKAPTPIGMFDASISVEPPLRSMAKAVNYVYTKAYDDNIAAMADDDSRADIAHRMISTIAIDLAEADRLWLQLSPAKRASSEFNALTVDSKLRSIGLDGDNPEAELSVRQIRELAETEHFRWCVEELALGYRQPTSAELRQIESDISLKSSFRDRMIHYDLRPYADLRADATGKNVDLYDLCLIAALPLIKSQQKRPKE